MTKAIPFSLAFNIPKKDLRESILSGCAHWGFAPTFVVNVVIELPFVLPFSKENIIQLPHDDRSYCMYLFSESQKHSLLRDKKKNDSIKDPVTVVEMLYVTSRLIEMSSYDAGEDADILIDYLNKIIFAYQLLAKDDSVYRISRLILFPISIVHLYDFNRDITYFLYVLLLHQCYPKDKKLLDLGAMETITNYVSAGLNAYSPFLIIEELQLTAQRYHNGGFYRETVIYAQMMVEEFIRTLYTQINLEEGVTVEQATRLREELPFLLLVKREMSGKIGGIWQINKSETEVGSWYLHTYLLRNRIVHGGYFPDFTEATSALNAASSMRNYIIRLVNNRRAIYPETAKYFERS